MFLTKRNLKRLKYLDSMDNDEIIKKHRAYGKGIPECKDMLNEARADATNKERERIVKLIESMANPYPSDVFLKPTKKELKEIIDALDRIREKRGLKADGVFGWMAKDGWNVCRTELIVKIREG